jgi:hypothetical protein
MAIDTATKRASVLHLSRAFALPVPDGSIINGDRQHLGWAYSGISTMVVLPSADPNPRRTLIVPLENRSLNVSLEDRTLIV